MKKIILFLAFLFPLIHSLKAQFSLTLQVPQTGVLLKPQLWNAVVVNSYPSSRQVYLGLTLSDIATGDPILTATTQQFTIATGSLLVQESNLSPITYDYLSSDITDRDPEGYLPAGSYSACYTLFEIQENSGTAVAQQCTPVTVEPVSPPVLNTPFNQQPIHNFFPQFTWIPPTPLEIFSNLNYDFTLVEVGDGQSAADAMQQNLPVYTTNVTDAYFNYPVSGNSLDTGKIYAWQVTAKNNSEFAAQSDIWTFSITDTGLINTNSNFSSYTKLKRVLDASLSVSVTHLLAYYENEAEDSAAHYSIYNIQPQAQNNQNLQLVDSGTVILSEGINLIDLPAASLEGLDDGKQYLFQLYNSRNEVWSMKFIYYKENKN